MNATDRQAISVISIKQLYNRPASKMLILPALHYSTRYYQTNFSKPKLLDYTIIFLAQICGQSVAEIITRPVYIFMGALNLQDRKMTDKEISGGGNCRTGK